MTHTRFDGIPVTPQEDEAFNQLGVGSEEMARNGADAPAPFKERTGLKSVAGSGAVPTPDLSHQRTDARAVDLSVAAQQHSPGRAPLLSARPGITLEISPGMFVAGVWACYAGLAVTSWLAT